MKRKGVVNKKQWMTDEITERMEKGRSHKHKTESIYKSINADSEEKYGEQKKNGIQKSAHK